MASEIQIQKKNLEAELATIKSEIDIEAGKLSEIKMQKESLENDSKLLQSQRVLFEMHKQDENKRFEFRKNEISEEKLRMINDRQLHEGIIVKLKEEIKESNKKLAWINEKILNGEDENETLLIKKLKLDEDIAKLLMIVAHKEEEEKKLKTATESRLSIEGSIHSKELVAEQKVSECSSQLVVLTTSLKKAIEERDKVQSDAKRYTDQLYTAMNDYEIVRGRLEARFKEHYPELELPLMA